MTQHHPPRPKAHRKPDGALLPAATLATHEAGVLRQPIQPTQLTQPTSQTTPQESDQTDEMATDEQPALFSHTLDRMSLFPLQAKLVVGATDDPAEDEADHVAEQVMRMAAPEAPTPMPAMPGATVIARKAASDTRYAEDASAVVQPVLQNGGAPLDDDTRSFMEPRFGHDFGSVRVHTGAQAESSAQAVNARAYTVGQDLVFGAGAYAPGTTAGKQLIAHELTHVVQQTPSLRRLPRTLRREAEEVDEPEVAAPAASPEEALAQAEAEVTEADVAQEPVEEVPAKPVALQDKEGGGAGGGGAGGGGGGASSASAAAPVKAVAPEAAAPDADMPPVATTTESLAAPDAKQPAGASNATVEEGVAGTNAVKASAVASASTPTQPEDVKDSKAAAITSPQASDAKATQPGASQVDAAAGSQANTTPEATQPTNERPSPTPAEGTGGPAPQAAATATPQGAEADLPAEAAPAQPKIHRKTRSPVIRRKVAPKSAAEDPAFAAVAQQVTGAAAQEKTHEPPMAKAEQAAAAAQMPAQEKKGQAQHTQAGEVSAAASAQQGRGAAAFDKAGFIAAVRAKIDQLTPKDPKQMENIEGSGVFSGAKQAVDQQVQSGKQAAQGDVADKAKEAPKTDAVPDKETTPLSPNKPGAAQTVDASGATPKSKDGSEVEVPIQAGSQQLDAQMAEANITEEQLTKSNEPQFQQSLAAKQESQTHAAAAPQTYRTVEDGQINTAKGEANTQTQTGLAQMQVQRGQAFAGVDQVQGGAKSADEQKRAEIGTQIDAIYNSAKTEVEGILSALDTAVDATFSRGAEAAKNAATHWIKQETKAYKDKRYEGAGGALTQFGDWLTDMPPEYFTIFKRGRDLYCEKMDGVISQVADIVADHMGRAKQRILQGRDAIADFVKQQPKALRGVAQEAANGALDKFKDLEQSVDDKQNEVVDSLASKYQESLQALDSELDALKAEDKGLWDKAKEAIGDTVKTIMELKAMLENALSRAADAVMKIIEDPIAFLGNLISGVQQGLQAFVGNIGTHLQQGLISWLTGALGSAGISLPKDFEPASIFQMVMELLGLTWANIRGQIVTALGPKGEQVMGALEQAWEVIQIIRTQGLAGLWQFVQGMIGDIKGMVIEQIKSMVTEQVIKAGIEWLVGMLGGPAGAFVKAAQGIVRIVTWFVNNGSRAMALVNSVIDSVSAIANGDIGGAAKFIEQSLAKALPMVISFLADLLGLGGVTKKVQEIIGKAKGLIDKGIHWVVGKAMALGKKLLSKLGVGEKDEAKPGEEPEKATTLEEGITAIHSKEQTYLHDGKISQESAQKVASSVMQTHSAVFSSISVADGGEKWDYEYVARASLDGAPKVEEGKVNAESLRTFRPKEWSSRSKTELAAMYPEAHEAGTSKLKSVKATSKGGNEYDKQLSDRRHITSFDDIKTDIIEKIHGATFADAAMTLQNKGFTASQLNNESILSAAQAYLTEKFNDIANVWVGDSEDNQERGRVMGQAKQAMEQATSDGQFREAYEQYRNAAYDPEPIDYFFDKYKAIRERKDKQ